MAYNTNAMRPSLDQVRDRSLGDKGGNFNQLKKQWIDQVGSVMENQFNIQGDKNGQWNKKTGDSYMDKSVEINADTILSNVRQVINHIKQNPPLAELNKKLIMAMVALQTASVASPAFAEGDITA